MISSARNRIDRGTVKPTQRYAMLQGDLLCAALHWNHQRKTIEMVGQKKAVATAVRNVSGRRRWSKLVEWLQLRT
jgi:exodeoxyribonuclease V alpha subunit